MASHNHHIKMFKVAKKIVYIHHKPNNPTDDEPGDPLSAPPGDKVRFKARDDGGFSITFKTESPFESGAGFPPPDNLAHRESDIARDTQADTDRYEVLQVYCDARGHQ